MASTDHPQGSTGIGGSGVDLTREPLQPDRSLGDLFSEMSTELSTLMRKELELAKVETKEEATKAGKAAGMLGAGALTGYLALLFVSLALAVLLADFMPDALGFLIVGVLYGIAAAVLGMSGKKKMQNVNPVPEQTVETLKEDAAWARAHKS